MKRISLWALSTVSAVVLLFGYHTSTSGVTDVATAPAQTGSFSSSSTATSSGSSSATGAGSGGGTGDDSTDSTPSASPSASPSSSANASSGTQSAKTVAGSVVDTRWGPVQVQVQVTLTGSRITDASVLQYPQNNGRDIEINNQALPILTQETVDAQSADIDMVSGATYTSNGYIQSLQAALDTAGV